MARGGLGYILRRFPLPLALLLRERMNGGNLWSAHTAGKRCKKVFSRARAVELPTGRRN